MSVARFSPGDRVRVSLVDPPHHTRAPRYVRGRVGRIHSHDGEHPLPDRVVVSRGSDRTPEPVYSVTFDADELWEPDEVAASGRFSVTVNLWESYLEAVR